MDKLIMWAYRYYNYNLCLFLQIFLFFKKKKEYTDRGYSTIYESIHMLGMHRYR